MVVPPDPRVNQTYISIQYLRAFSALLVVIIHLHTSNILPPNNQLHWMFAGVDIFFVISGFIMVKSTEARDIHTGQFLLKRIIRVVPLYWLLTAIMATSKNTDFWHNFASFLFIPAIHPRYDDYQPVLTVGWTLNYEMFFYLIFGLSLNLRERHRLAAVALILILLVAIGQFTRLPGTLGFYCNPIILEFVAGMAIAKYRIKLRSWSIPAALIALPILWQHIDYRLISFGLPAVALVAGCAAIEPKIRPIRFLNVLGDASYALYLAHLMAFGLAVELWVQYLPMSLWFVPFALAFTILVAVILHFVCERPLAKILGEWARFLRVKKETHLHPSINIFR